ncbi:MAG: hypothetical protein KAX38_03890 [Candidatus Krumholzibacteria bacterium]|nr:hypothetical protein [Candidatus Krumholzibacteria bacterium]
MRPKLRLFSLLIVLVCVSAVLAGTLKSRVDYLAELPVHRHFRCAICHNSKNPESSSDLNKFGQDFKNNAYKWDSNLAMMDSDGDGYSNGIEIGDEYGDGTPEVYLERSNPGDPDNYPNSINAETWSIIKSLFED